MNDLDDSDAMPYLLILSFCSTQGKTYTLYDSLDLMDLTWRRFRVFVPGLDFLWGMSSRTIRCAVG